MPGLPPQPGFAGASSALARPTFLIGMIVLRVGVLTFVVVSNLKATGNQIVVNTTSDTASMR